MTRPVLDLQAGVAVITGGASGIGLGLAKACARAGMKVAVTDISAARLDEAGHVLTALDAEHRLIEHDVTSEAAWTRVVRQSEAELGPALLLFNNAGVVTAPAPVIDTDPAAWDWLMATNLTAAFLGARAFAPGMAARGRGHITNTASIQALVASPGFGAYTAAKFGLLGMSETLRIELEPAGVGVSVICPGATRTDLFPNSRTLAPAFGAAGANPRAAIDHYLSADEVAAMALEAVIANRFYVITHPEYGGLLKARLAALEQSFGPAGPDHQANIETVEADALAGYRNMRP